MASSLSLSFFRRKLLLTCLLFTTIFYASFSLYLYLQQRYLIFRPQLELQMLPTAPDFNLRYQNIKISITNNKNEYLDGWWFDAPKPHDKIDSIPNEPVKILSSPKTILYLCGAGGNKSYYNYLARIQAMQQLGFSVLVIDYRGFGESKGKQHPNESQIYQDSQAAWNYLVNKKRISPKDIIVYGESLGGAVAIDLAVKHPQAGGLIVQSSFTSMAETVKQQDWLKIFPIDLLLTQKFNSIAKIKKLQIPVLFIHGSADSVVPSYMSSRLYNLAPEPKQLFKVPQAGHFRIYKPGNKSYLKAIEKFIKSIES
ncbi:prolyl oligopeptidase family protein [Rivularia sp. PCC 7116]|uniref:alpha/beta hydrolase n=1 Tax=Rivularia sp. PCC 7116 TaxID=373994 RepID=UPI00029F1495|nr:alpha/beta hydrolase [Rivularia sp. PCC 7116]AFY53120.1 prolyl oligopeptidase family protein [Rivularia sp. PCC 7116]